MEHLKTLDSNFRWAIGPIRTTYSQPDYDSALERAESSGSSLAVVCQLTSSWSISLCSSTPHYDIADFGVAVADFAKSRNIERLIYIELIDSNKVLTVAVSPESIVDSIDLIDALPDVINRLQRNDTFKILAAASEILDEEFAKTGNLQPEFIFTPLTVELEPQPYQFKKISEALEVKSSVLIWPILLITLVGIIAAIYTATKPEPPPPPVNPHIMRVEQTTRLSISVLTRANQIIDAFRQLRGVVGWKLINISQGKNSLAFRMQPTTNETGSLLSELEQFCKRYGFSMLVEPNAQDSTVLLIKEPVNTVNTLDARIFDVEQVITFINDAIALYIPKSKLTIIRTTPDSSREWGTVELVIDMNEVNYRYLNTLGAILIGLPISLGGGPAEIAVGDLTVAGENITGSIKLVVFGQRQNWQ